MCVKVKRGAEQTLSQPDICIIELGGTVGDIESMPFIEALRQVRETRTLILSLIDLRICACVVFIQSGT